jgi:hypothetical protein
MNALRKKVKGERERREEAGEYELGDGKTNQYETNEYAAGKAGPRQAETSTSSIESETEMYV